MPIPKDILAVERPKNTVVTAYGKNHDLYAVRERTGCKHVGKRNIPVTGKTIGHIINHVFVPCEPEVNNKIKYAETDTKYWANIQLCVNVSADILEELKDVYTYDDAIKIYCIAILRVCKPGVEDCELKVAYNESFLSELYPHVGMSKNTVGDHLENLGRTSSRIVKFMQNRVAKIKMDDTLLIDSTLKTDNSKVDTLSEFSRKSRVRGQKDLSVMYLVSLTTKEPVCSKCYPGNMLDVTAYSDFVKENNIVRGVLVADKGFPMSSITKILDENPELYYLNPVKRNSTLIKTHNMTEYTNVLAGYPSVTYKKEKVIGENKWVYAFRDADAAYKEEKTWLENRSKNNSYNEEELRKDRLKFGTIVLESNLDADPKDIYKMYKKRWEIELVMKYYKSALELDDTREHNDYTVIGSEFCDFIASVISCKLINKFDEIGLLEKNEYQKIMRNLGHAKKSRATSNGEWCPVKIIPSHEEMLIDLGLFPKPEVVKRKVGRPPKSSI